MTGNAGLGKEAARQFAKHNPKEVVIAARTPSKAEATIAEIKQESPNANISLIQIDLSSFKSVKKAADEFLSRHSRLDILLNNAGIMGGSFSKTEDGYERQFGTCHMGHALLTKLLLPTLLATAKEPSSDVRIVNLSSEGHNFSGFSRGLIYDPVKAETTNPNVLYGTAKLANILHARGLAKHYPSILSVSLHPGVIDTQLLDTWNAYAKNNAITNALFGVFKKVGFSTVEKGTYNTLWCCTAPRAEVAKGYYYKPVGSRSSGNGYAKDMAGVDKLWEYTEAELAKHGYGGDGSATATSTA